MTSQEYSLSYPRKQLVRALIRCAGRLLLPVLFKLDLSGRDNFPTQGPLLVVGNHTAAMEAVLLNIYSPWQIEMLSAADTPAEKFTELVINIYGAIPLHRGSYDRSALTNALDVLKQDGFIGLFPEGGIWQEGKKKALPGIAWLSYRSGAPVLPIGFSDTSGAMNAALKLQRPRISMRVGKVIPAAQRQPGTNRKAYLQTYADQVMEAVHQLVPQEDYQTEPEIVDEHFQLEIHLIDQDGNQLPIPRELQIQNRDPLAKFLHRPAILKIFRVNLELPVDPLERLSDQPPAADLLLASQVILEYLNQENPYLLTYRFGVKEGSAMQQGLEELKRLVEYCLETDCLIHIQPIRYYFSIRENQEIKQVAQGRFQSWM